MSLSFKIAAKHKAFAYRTVIMQNRTKENIWLET